MEEDAASRESKNILESTKGPRLKSAEPHPVGCILIIMNVDALTRNQLLKLGDRINLSRLNLWTQTSKKQPFWYSESLG